MKKASGMPLKPFDPTTTKLIGSCSDMKAPEILPRLPSNLREAEVSMN